MSVSLTISESMGGSAINDALEGGGTGVDLGSVVNGSYAPVTDKTSNTGKQDLWIKHDAVIDPITDLKVFIQQYGLGTGYTYGGAVSAASDYTGIKALGNASGGSKNNADGNSGGLWMDMNHGVSEANQFDFVTNGGGAGTDSVRIFGDNTDDGTDLAEAFLIDALAMVYNNSGTPTTPTTPVDGKIGKLGDTVLGDNAHMKFRIYLPQAHADGGIMQWEVTWAFSYTA